MFSYKIIKKSKLKEMEYTVSMYNLDKNNLISMNERLAFKAEILSKTNVNQANEIAFLKSEIDRLTPQRDDRGRFSDRK